MESMNLELGTKGSIFKLNYRIYGYLETESWMKYLWDSVHEHAIEIDDVVDKEKILRRKDRMLAVKFVWAVKNNLVSRGYWGAANRCRLYLKALTIADIATGDGQVIDIDIRKGIRQERRARDVDWPIQGRPSKTN